MQLQFHVAVYQIPCEVDDVINFFRNNYNQLIWGFNILIEKNLFRDAQLLLGNAIDIQDIFEFSFPNETRIKFLVRDELVKKIRDIEIKTAMKPYEFHTKDFLNDHKKMREKQASNEHRVLSDKDIENIALRALDAYEIPKDRLPNIVSEVKAYQKFELLNKNPDIVLTVNQQHLEAKATTYLYPSIYVIVSKKTGFKSNPSINIDELLTAFKYLMQTS